MTIEDTLNSHEARLSRFDDAFGRVAVAIEQLTQLATRADERQDAADERQDASDSARRESDERLEALINAQVRYEARQERLEEAFRQVAESHQTLVQLASIHEERLDGHDEASVHTESRLDALIDSQMQLTRHVNAFNGRFDQMTARVEQVAESVDRLAGHVDKMAGAIETLTTAQARTDEQIRLLLDRNGSKEN